MKTDKLSELFNDLLFKYENKSERELELCGNYDTEDAEYAEVYDEIRELKAAWDNAVKEEQNA